MIIHNSKGKVSADARILTVEIKGFILKCEPLADIAEGEFGASSFQREMLEIGKMDVVNINLCPRPAENPL